VKRHAPAVARNREPILEVLRRWLPARGLVLEIASGTGEHAAFFAAAFPDLVFQPSDPDPDARASIAAWRVASDLPNLRAPLALDVAQPDWPVASADAIVCINMLHISPWSAAEALVAGAARTLPLDGVLYLYGPYRRAGHSTAASNEAFDADLRRRNSAWGLRRLEDVVALAGVAGFAHRETIEMPANNLSVVFRRTAAA
jgi:SAM-dependent methyltransferase